MVERFIPGSVQSLDLRNWPNVKDNPDLLVALVAASNAGRMLQEAFRTQFETHVKEDNSDFTPFDKQAEEIAKEEIRRYEPESVIMGEEIAPDEDISGKNFWVIDGIDGTTNFARGIPVCNFTMAKVVEGRTRLGVVFDFLHGEMFYALRGKGAFLNGERIQVTERPLRESLISYAPLLNVREGRKDIEGPLVEAVWAGMREITEASGRFPREIQSGGLELSWLASGRLDSVATSWTSPWDLSAGVLLVREAGGIATNILGEDWEPSYMGVIAGSKTIHPQMLDILQKHYHPKI